MSHDLYYNGKLKIVQEYLKTKGIGNTNILEKDLDLPESIGCFLKIDLKLVDIKVWRRVVVPEHFNLEELHKVIQMAFGWGTYHLYMFSPKGYGSYPSYGDGEEDGDPGQVTVGQIFKKYKKFKYIYDFGDDWTHTITLEKIGGEKISIPSLLSGAGKCPPEDCGGIPGYANMLEVLNNPKGSEYKDMRRWLGLIGKEQYDPNEFDLISRQKFFYIMFNEEEE